MPDKKTIIFVGLGNPGNRYRTTRHNIGFMVLDEMAAQIGVSFKEESRFGAALAKGSYKGQNVVLFKPLTFMNASGEAVGRLLHFNKWSADQLVLICDDVAIPFGSMRLRESGSDGGHNGLKSVAHHIGTNHYVRLRMGVGNPEVQGEWDLADFVLASFVEEERGKLESFIKKGGDIACKLVLEDPATVMNQINQKNSHRVNSDGKEK
jgi:PTH1 family peptidyl-tRNA hydrolase